MRKFRRRATCLAERVKRVRIIAGEPVAYLYDGSRVLGLPTVRAGDYVLLEDDGTRRVMPGRAFEAQFEEIRSRAKRQ